VTDLVIEQVSLEAFYELKSNNQGAISPQRVVIEAMDTGTAIILEHGRLACYHKPGGAGCGFGSVARLAGKKTGKHYMTRHLPDGRVAIACVEA